MEKLEKIKQIARNLLPQDSLTLSMFDNIHAGKMLRSKLILAICDNDEALMLCAIIELIHCASLLHDDVIDDSLKRRGNMSINAMFGNKNAIMLGDILYSSAFYKLSQMNAQIAQSVSKSVSMLSLGELQDVDLSNNFNDNEELYLNMITNKSASLIASSAHCAGIIRYLNTQNDENNHCNNAHEKDQNLQNKMQQYYDYGLNLGIAFQIIDDILDITQDEKTLGKPNFSDFANGKTTLPYMYLYKNLDDENKKWLQSCFKKTLAKNDHDKLETMLVNYTSLAKKKALFYAQNALTIANDLENEKLKYIVESMVQREF